MVASGFYVQMLVAETARNYWLEVNTIEWQTFEELNRDNEKLSHISWFWDYYCHGGACKTSGIYAVVCVMLLDLLVIHERFLGEILFPMCA